MDASRSVNTAVYDGVGVVVAVAVESVASADRLP